MSNKLPKAVLADLDGTIMESGDIWKNASMDAAARFGIYELTPTQHKQFMGVPFGRILLEGGAPPDLVKAITDFREDVLAITLNRVEWLPGGAELLDFMKEHMKTALISNGHQSAFDVMDRKLDIARRVHEVILFDHVKPHSKPHPKGIELALAKFGLEPKDALFFGDHENDMLAAKAADVPFVLRRHEGNADLRVDVEVATPAEFQQYLLSL